MCEQKIGETYVCQTGIDMHVELREANVEGRLAKANADIYRRNVCLPNGDRCACTWRRGRQGRLKLRRQTRTNVEDNKTYACAARVCLMISLIGACIAMHKMLSIGPDRASCSHLSLIEVVQQQQRMQTHTRVQIHMHTQTQTHAYTFTRACVDRVARDAYLRIFDRHAHKHA